MGADPMVLDDDDDDDDGDEDDDDDDDNVRVFKQCSSQISYLEVK